jgi:hypothetical protein
MAGLSPRRQRSASPGETALVCQGHAQPPVDEVSPAQSESRLVRGQRQEPICALRPHRPVPRRMIMRPLPAPETIFGSQELTQEDHEAHGSRFRDVKAAIFANPYQPVWGAPDAPPLPYYKTTNTSVYAGSFPGGSPPPIQTGLDQSAGFPGGSPVGRRWQRLSQTGAPHRRLRHRRLGHHRRQSLFRLF